MAEEMSAAQGVDFRIDPEIFERFAQIQAGGFLVDRLDTATEGIPEGFFGTIRRELEASGLTLQNLPDDARIRGWREAIGRCGLKPSAYKSSPEQLARRLLKGKEISTPIPLVDAYCAVSVRHLATLGGYDLDRLPAAEIDVRLAHPERDHFQPIGARPEDMPLGEDVVVYASGETVLCYAFNHRDSAESSLLRETRRGLFVGEAVNAAQADALVEALQELSLFLADRGAQPGPIAYIDSSTPGCRLTFAEG